MNVNKVIYSSFIKDEYNYILKSVYLMMSAIRSTVTAVFRAVPR